MNYSSALNFRVLETDSQVRLRVSWSFIVYEFSLRARYNSSNQSPFLLLRFHSSLPGSLLPLRLCPHSKQNKDKPSSPSPPNNEALAHSSPRLIGSNVNWQLHCASEWMSCSATTLVPRPQNCIIMAESHWILPRSIGVFEMSSTGRGHPGWSPICNASSRVTK